MRASGPAMSPGQGICLSSGYQECNKDLLMVVLDHQQSWLVQSVYSWCKGYIHLTHGGLEIK